MKTAFVAAILVALAFTSTPTDAVRQQSQRKLILGSTIVPAKTKTYTVGLRKLPDGKNFCGGSLVSPMHVLTTSHCTPSDIRWASIGSRYLNGTQDGEQIKVVAVMNHRNFSVNINFGDDFALLELERPSSYKPVKLAAADDSDFKAGATATATALGWGLTSEGGAMSQDLRRVDLPLIIDQECEQVSAIDNTMVCAGGLISADVCDGDSGGPLVLESPYKDGDDVLIGVVSWTKGDACGRGPNYPGIYSRVSSARSWINPITSSSCFE